MSLAFVHVVSQHLCMAELGQIAYAHDLYDRGISLRTVIVSVRPCAVKESQLIGLKDLVGSQEELDNPSQPSRSASAKRQRR